MFTRRKKVIFIHGCFWHQHAAADCADSRRPKSNTGYWDAKLARNAERDQQHVEKLSGEGWEVLILWDCELARSDLNEWLSAFLGAPRQGHAQ